MIFCFSLFVKAPYVLLEDYYRKTEMNRRQGAIRKDEGCGRFKFSYYGLTNHKCLSGYEFFMLMMLDSQEVVPTKCGTMNEEISCVIVLGV